MATAPKAEITQTTQPVRPIYGDPNAARGAFGNPLGAVAEAGQRFSQVADSLVEAQLRIQDRNDAVARARDFLPFQAFGRESLTALQATDDISNPMTVQKYRQTLDDKAAEILGAHSGSENSRAALETRLLEQKLEFMDTAAVASTTAGRKAVQDQLGADLGGISARVAADPSTFSAELDNWNKSIDNMRPVLTPEEERAWARQGPAVMVEAILDGMLTQPNGDIEVQRLISSTPGLMAMMEPAQQVEVRKRIQTVAQYNAAERNKTYTLGRDQVIVNSAGKVIARGPTTPPAKTKAQEVAETLAVAAALGRTPTGEQLDHVIGLGSPGNTQQTAAEKIADLEAAFASRGWAAPTRDEAGDYVGLTPKPKTLAETVAEIQAVRAANKQPPLTDEQLTAVQGIIKSDKTLPEKVKEAEQVVGPLTRPEMAKLGQFYVSSTEEKNRFDDDDLQTFVDLAPRWGEGTTTPEETREIEAAVINYTQLPAPIFDPDTGIVTPVPAKILPDYVRRAAQARGFRIPNDTETPIQPGTGQPGDQGTAQPQPGQRPGPTKEAAAPLPQPGIQPQAAPAEQQTQEPEPVAQQREVTIYEQAPLLTGPVATVGPGLGKLPVPGLAGSFGEQRTAQASFSLASQELISAIRDARYYSAPEQEDLETEVNIKGGALTDAKAFRQDLIGIDKALERRLDNALKAISSERTTRDERRKAIEVANAIENFRRILLPPIVETPDEETLFLRDNPGASYLTPDGKGGFNLRKGPGAADGE